MPFVQTAHSLDPANLKNLMSVDNTRAKRVIDPISAAMVTPAHMPVSSWNGGVPGDDQILAKTNVKVDTIGPNAPVGDYEPRNQDDKAKMPGASPPNAIADEPDFTIVTDVTRPRGSIGPLDPYPDADSDPVPDPVLTSLTPATAVAGAPGPMAVLLTGTDFTQWTKVLFDNIDMPTVTPVSDTQMIVVIDPSKYEAGVVDVFVWDHSVSSDPVEFTFT